MEKGKKESDQTNLKDFNHKGKSNQLRSRDILKLIKIPVLFAAVILFTLLFFSKDIVDYLGKSNTPGENHLISEIDKIKWNGSIYKGTEVITGDLIGIKLGEIIDRATENQELKDGQATKIEAGTMVYSVAGTENIAVKFDGKWLMYVKEEKALAILNTYDPSLSNEEIASLLFEQFLEKKKKATDPSIKIKNYRISEIKIEKESANGFIFSIIFDELPANWDRYIYAGNGLIENEWIQEFRGVDNQIENPRPAWKVIATYPMGNQEVFYIDAFKGDNLLLQEREAKGSM